MLEIACDKEVTKLFQSYDKSRLRTFSPAYRFCCNKNVTTKNYFQWMGYRALLKQYMAQLKALHGDDFVEILAQDNRLSKRDAGELRAIAAELKREALRDASSELK